MGIYIVIAFVSLLYLCIGYFINKKNSKYLLAGYNTMSDDERKKFDIDNFLKFFKYNFKLQSLLSILIYISFKLLINEKIGLISYSFFLILFDQLLTISKIFFWLPRRLRFFITNPFYVIPHIF